MRVRLQTEQWLVTVTYRHFLVRAEHSIATNERTMEPVWETEVVVLIK